MPAVDLGWLAEEDAAASFRAYRALPDEDRASVLAHAVASLTVPHLADDRDVSGAHEEAVCNLEIDFPAELAAIGAQPFDQDLVWNRMNKGLILGAASQTLGDDWASKHSGLKKKDLAAATAEAFRHDPARDNAVNAAAVRWLPPGFAPVADIAEPAPEETPVTDTDIRHRPLRRAHRQLRKQRRCRRSAGQRRPGRGYGHGRRRQRQIRRSPGHFHSRQRRRRVPCRRRRSPRLPHLLRLLHPRRNGAGPFGPAAPPKARRAAFFSTAFIDALIRALTRAIRGDPPHGGGSAETLRPYRRAARRPVPGALRAALRPAGPGRPRRRIATACLRRSTP